MVKGIMLSAAITSIVCGVTEPLEFSFVFVAPVLYLIHAVITGLGFALLVLLDVHVGLSFSGGLIDFILFGVLPGTGKTNWIMVIPVGLAVAFIYYFGFRFAITKWNLATPGREKEEAKNESHEVLEKTGSLSEKVLIAFGGKENISELNACMSRLRITVNDTALVNKPAIKSLGAAGIFENGNHIQAVFGLQADTIKEEMKILMQDGTLKNPLNAEIHLNEKTIQNANDTDFFEKFAAPCGGKIVRIQDISDPVFSSKSMGDGFAIDIEENTISAPFDGEIVSVFPKKHAISLRGKDNYELLIHIGLDTVKLKGEGFNVLVQAGQTIQKGQKLVEIDRELIISKGYSLVTPIIFTNLDLEKHHIVLDKVSTILRGEERIVHLKENQARF